MEIKGISIVSRREQIVREFGEPAWEGFLAEMARKDPFFKQSVMATDLLPADKVLAFNDAVVERFYGGDPRAYWRLGEQGAQWALQEGPYRLMLARKDLQAFIEKSLMRLWSTYFTGGKLELRLEGSALDVRISQLPVAHVYFEYLVCGYATRSLELFGVRQVRAVRLAGFDSPDKVIHYRMEFERP